jgi:hypothetical protein
MSVKKLLKDWQLAIDYGDGDKFARAEWRDIHAALTEARAKPYIRIGDGVLLTDQQYRVTGRRTVETSKGFSTEYEVAHIEGKDLGVAKWLPEDLVVKL